MALAQAQGIQPHIVMTQYDREEKMISPIQEGLILHLGRDSQSAKSNSSETYFNATWLA